MADSQQEYRRTRSAGGHGVGLRRALGAAALGCAVLAPLAACGGHAQTLDGAAVQSPAASSASPSAAASPTTPTGGTQGGENSNTAAASLSKHLRAATEKYRSAHTSMEMRTTVNGQTTDITETGVAGWHPVVSEMAISLPADGTTASMTEIVTSTTEYLKIPGSDSVTHGKPWMKVALSGLGAAGELASRSMSAASSNDPSSQFQMLGIPGSTFSKIGPATVHGVATTHYTSTVGTAAALAASKDATLRSVLKADLAKGIETLTTDLWVDARYRTVQIHLVDSSASAVLVDARMNYSDYSTEAPKITLPPASQVYDATSQVAGQLGTAAQGG